MSLLRKTPKLELDNFTHLLQVNENYLLSCEKERTETIERYRNFKLTFEVMKTKTSYLQKEIKDTKKSIEKYKAKIAELKNLLNE